MKKIIFVTKSSMRFDSRVKKISNSLHNAGYDLTVVAEKKYKDLSYKEHDTYLLKRLFTVSGLYAKEDSFNPISQSYSTKKRKSLKSIIKNCKLRILIIVFLNRIIWNTLCFIELVKKRYDLIIARDPNTLIVTYLASIITRKPVFYECHEIWSSSNLYLNSSRFMQWVWDTAEKLITPKLDCVLITTETKKRIMEEKFNISGVVVLRHTLPLYELKQDEICDLHAEFDIPKTNKILIYHGQVSRIRGVFDLVEAARSLANVSVVFMGMGNDIVELANYIEDEQINNVFFKKPVPPEQVVPSIAGADIGVQPFHYTENIYSETSNKLFECMMAELACIGISFPEIKAVIEGKQIGLCYESGNVDMLRKQIELLTTDEELLAKSKANSKKYKREFTWEEDEKILLERVYETIGN